MPKEAPSVRTIEAKQNWAASHEEAKGVVCIEVVRPGDVAAVVQQSKRGNRYYTTMLQSMRVVDTALCRPYRYRGRRRRPEYGGRLPAL